MSRWPAGRGERFDRWLVGARAANAVPVPAGKRRRCRRHTRPATGRERAPDQRDRAGTKTATRCHPATRRSARCRATCWREAWLRRNKPFDSHHAGAPTNRQRRHAAKTAASTATRRPAQNFFEWPRAAGRQQQLTAYHQHADRDQPEPVRHGNSTCMQVRQHREHHLWRAMAAVAREGVTTSVTFDPRVHGWAARNAHARCRALGNRNAAEVSRLPPHSACPRVVESRRPSPNVQCIDVEAAGGFGRTQANNPRSSWLVHKVDPAGTADVVSDELPWLGRDSPPSSPSA